MSSLQYPTFSNTLSHFGLEISIQGKALVEFSLLGKPMYLLFINDETNVEQCYCYSDKSFKTQHDIIVEHSHTFVNESHLQLVLKNIKPAYEIPKIEKKTKLNKALNAVVGLKKIKGKEKDYYSKSFIKNSLFTDSKKQLILPMHSINTDIKGAYDFLIITDLMDALKFQNEESMFHFEKPEAENISIFFDGLSLVDYSLVNEQHNCVTLIPNPCYNIKTILQQVVSFDQTYIHYMPSSLNSLRKTLEFLCAYISYSTDDFYDFQYSKGRSSKLKLYIRSEYDLVTRTNLMSALTNIDNNTIGADPLDGEQVENINKVQIRQVNFKYIDKFNTSLEIKNLTYVLRHLIETLIQSYELSTKFNFMQVVAKTDDKQDILDF